MGLGPWILWKRPTSLVGGKNWKVDSNFFKGKESTLIPALTRLFRLRHVFTFAFIAALLWSATGANGAGRFADILGEVKLTGDLVIAVKRTSVTGEPRDPSFPTKHERYEYNFYVLDFEKNKVSGYYAPDIPGWYEANGFDAKGERAFFAGANRALEDTICTYDFKKRVYTELIKLGGWVVESVYSPRRNSLFYTQVNTADTSKNNLGSTLYEFDLTSRTLEPRFFYKGDIRVVDYAQENDTLLIHENAEVEYCSNGAGSVRFKEFWTFELHERRITRVPVFPDEYSGLPQCISPDGNTIVFDGNGFGRKSIRGVPIHVAHRGGFRVIFVESPDLPDYLSGNNHFIISPDGKYLLVATESAPPTKNVIPIEFSLVDLAFEGYWTVYTFSFTMPRDWYFVDWYK